MTGFSSNPIVLLLLSIVASIAAAPIPIAIVNARGVGTVKYAHFDGSAARIVLSWFAAIRNTLKGAAKKAAARKTIVARALKRLIPLKDRAAHLAFNQDGFVMIDTGGTDDDGAPRKRRRNIDPPVVQHSGTAIVLPGEPTPMSLKTAIEWLAKMQAEEETMINVSETIDAYPWDGARAMMIAIRQRFGFAQTKGNMFDPPRTISVKTDIGHTESVAWGQFEIPGVNGRLSTGSTYNEAGQQVFLLTAHVPKKHARIISELADLTREILKTQSIYRGKAVRFSVDEDGDAKVPDFIDLSRVNPAELVYSADVAEQIETTVFAPLRRREWCNVLGAPFKRGVCLLGAYGVGKTLAVYVAAQHAKAAGITAVVIEDARRLPDGILFARQYAPALVIVEDVDRVTRERDDLCNEIMDSLDGVEAKESDVMVLFTSNHADHIHEAMRRPGRIDTFIKIEAPDAAAVEKLLRLYGRGMIGASENLMEPCELLAGQIPAVVREVVERAKLAAIARAETLEDARRLTAHDLTVAAKRLIMQQQLFAPKVSSRNFELDTAVATLGAAMLATAPRNGAALKGNGHAARV